VFSFAILRLPKMGLVSPPGNPTRKAIFRQRNIRGKDQLICVKRGTFSAERRRIIGDCQNQRLLQPKLIDL
jgi:hypothetical protein